MNKIKLYYILFRAKNETIVEYSNDTIGCSEYINSQ
jgi:hypothetical protein